MFSPPDIGFRVSRSPAAAGGISSIVWQATESRIAMKAIFACHPDARYPVENSLRAILPRSRSQVSTTFTGLALART